MDYKQQLEKIFIKKECNSIGFFLFIILILAQIISISMLLVSDDSSYAQFLIQSITSIIIFFVVGIIYCKSTNASLNSIIPFQKNKFSKTFLFILLGFSTTLIANFLAMLFSASISVFGIPTSLDTELSSKSLIEKLLYILSVSVIPALVEEFTFRGIILGKSRKYGDTFAIFFSALTFGLMHGNLGQIPFAFICGMVFAFITIKANSLLPAIIVHFLNNFSSVILDILISNNIFQETFVYIIYTTITLITMICAIIALLLLSKKDNNIMQLKKSEYALPFNQKIKYSICNAGMICFNVYVIFEVILYALIGILL